MHASDVTGLEEYDTGLSGMKGWSGMLRGQVAVFLSCSEKFKHAVAWPVRDALASHGMHGIVVSDEPRLPGTGRDTAAKVGSYLNASSAFVALCTADHEVSDGTRFPQANIIEEIELAAARPHLRDHSQILTSPGVLLPSSMNPTRDQLDIARPAGAAAAIVKQLQEWGFGLVPPGPPAQWLATDADAAGDLNALFADPHPGDHAEARCRVYRLLRDRGEVRRRWIARALHGEILRAGEPARRLAAASLLEAMSGLDAALVTVKMIEVLATSPEYVPRACAANLLRDRVTLAPLDIPVGLLGRLAWPSGEDWLVAEPAMAAVKELILSRPDAYVIFESLTASTAPQDRHAVARALLDVAAVRPAAVAHGLAERLAKDPDPLVAQVAGEVMAAIGHAPDN
jgi:hypothetical protein